MQSSEHPSARVISFGLVALLPSLRFEHPVGKPILVDVSNRIDEIVMVLANLLLVAA